MVDETSFHNQGELNEWQLDKSSETTEYTLANNESKAKQVFTTKSQKCIISGWKSRHLPGGLLHYDDQ